MSQTYRNSDINPSDKDSLLAFFAKYNKLSESELAILADRSTYTIRRWKRLCGLSENKQPIYKPITYKKKLPEIIGDWDNPEWFDTMYHKNNYGIHQIATMINKAIRTVEKRFKKYGIRTKSHKGSTKSKNPFCNRDWLHRHYIELRWSKQRCADAACVTRNTISNWLAHFKIIRH